MKSISTIVLLFVSLQLYAQVSSYILSSETGEAVPFAIVQVKGAASTTADANGKIILEDGATEISISSIGYNELTLKAAEIGDTIKLVPAAELLPEAIVSAQSITNGAGGVLALPGSAYAITQKELQRFGHTDINKQLALVPGLNLQEEDGFGLRVNVGMRGSGVERSSKITIMEDGILSAPAPYAAPAAYYFPTAGRMHSIEVRKGSSQIQYGPYTNGGAINLVSTPVPNDLSGFIRASAGSFGTWDLHAGVGHKTEQVGLLVETFQYGSNGFKQVNGIKGSSGFHKSDINGKLQFYSKETAAIKQVVTIKGGYATETSDDTYLGLTEDDFNADPFFRYAGSAQDEMTTSHSQVSFTHQMKFLNGFEIHTSLYRNDFKRNWYKLDKVKTFNGDKIKIASLLNDPSSEPEAFGIINGVNSLPDAALQVKANNRSYYAMGAQTKAAYQFEIGKTQSEAVIGLRYHIDEIDRFQWVDEYEMLNGEMILSNKGIEGTESNRVEIATAFAAFLQYKLHLGKLSIQPGLRLESIKIARTDYGTSDPERQGTSVSERENDILAIIPGIGVDYAATSWMTVFAGVHKGFAPSGSKEETDQESSINYELGTRMNVNGFSAQIIGFYNDYSNLLGADLAAGGGTGSGDLFNGGEATTFGLESQLVYNILHKRSSKFRMPLTVSYTFTDARFDNSFESEFDGWGDVVEDDFLPYVSQHQLSTQLTLEHKLFSISTSTSYVSDMLGVAGQFDDSDASLIKGRFLLNANADYSINKNFSVFATMTNITNKVYVASLRPAGLRPGMPRAWRLGVRANF